MDSNRTPAPWSLFVLETGLGMAGMVGVGWLAMPKHMSKFFDYLYFNSRGLPVAIPNSDGRAKEYNEFVWGLLGVVTTCWVTSLLLTVKTKEFRQGRKEAWRTVAIPVGLWFIVESAYTLAKGYWTGCLLNIGFIAVLGGPLAVLKYTASHDTKDE